MTMQTAAQMRSALDQRWAEAREWMWSTTAEQAAQFDRLVNTTDPRHLVVAMRSDRRVAFDARYLIALAYDELLCRMLDEQIAEGDGEAAAAIAAQEAHE